MEGIFNSNSTPASSALIKGKGKKIEIEITIEDEVKEKVGDVQDLAANIIEMKKKEATAGWGTGFTKNKKKRATPSMIKKQLEEAEKEAKELEEKKRKELERKRIEEEMLEKERERTEQEYQLQQKINEEILLKKEREKELELEERNTTKGKLLESQGGHNSYNYTGGGGDDNFNLIHSHTSQPHYADTGDNNNFTTSTFASGLSSNSNEELSPSFRVKRRKYDQEPTTFNPSTIEDISQKNGIYGGGSNSLPSQDMSHYYNNNNMYSGRESFENGFSLPSSSNNSIYEGGSNNNVSIPSTNNKNSSSFSEKSFDNTNHDSHHTHFNPKKNATYKNKVQASLNGLGINGRPIQVGGGGGGGQNMAHEHSHLSSSARDFPNRGNVTTGRIEIGGGGNSTYMNPVSPFGPQSSSIGGGRNDNDTSFRQSDKTNDKSSGNIDLGEDKLVLLKKKGIVIGGGGTPGLTSAILGGNKEVLPQTISGYGNIEVGGGGTSYMNKKSQQQDDRDNRSITSSYSSHSSSYSKSPSRNRDREQHYDYSSSEESRSPKSSRRRKDYKSKNNNGRDGGGRYNDRDRDREREISSDSSSSRGRYRDNERDRTHDRDGRSKGYGYERGQGREGKEGRKRGNRRYKDRDKRKDY